MLGTTLEFLDGILLGIYVGIELGYLGFSNDGTKDDKFDGLLLGYWLGSVDTLELGNN